MLVLSRQRDETIMIGDEIEITVVDIRGDKVRLGITAPSKIAVHRKEVYEAIKRENEQASQQSTRLGHDLPTLRPAATNGVPSLARSRTQSLSSGTAPQPITPQSPGAPVPPGTPPPAAIPINPILQRPQAPPPTSASELRLRNKAQGA